MILERISHTAITIFSVAVASAFLVVCIFDQSISWGYLGQISAKPFIVSMLSLSLALCLNGGLIYLHAKNFHYMYGKSAGANMLAGIISVAMGISASAAAGLLVAIF